MASLKQGMAPKAKAQDPTISMPMSELRALVASISKDLESRMEAVEQKLLLLEGRVAAELDERGIFESKS